VLFLLRLVFSIPSQEIGFGKRLRNDLSLFCVKWDVKASSALTLLVGRQEGHPACKKTECWGAGVVICLERGAD